MLNCTDRKIKNTQYGRLIWVVRFTEIVVRRPVWVRSGPGSSWHVWPLQRWPLNQTRIANPEFLMRIRISNYLFTWFYLTEFFEVCRRVRTTSSPSNFQCSGFCRILRWTTLRKGVQSWFCLLFMQALKYNQVWSNSRVERRVES